MDKSVLLKHATVFRRGLEVYYQKHPTATHSTDFVNPIHGRFPEGHCKAASFMFGHYLKEAAGMGDSVLEYAYGTKGDITHGWLQCDGYIIDLTADQIPGIMEPVIVRSIGASDWHSGFKPHSVFAFNLRDDHEFCEVAEEVGKMIAEEAV